MRWLLDKIEQSGLLRNRVLEHDYGEITRVGGTNGSSVSSSMNSMSVSQSQSHAIFKARLLGVSQNGLFFF